jgi:class 3 adenylate cyclase
MASRNPARDRIFLAAFALVWAWCLLMRFLSLSHPTPRSAYLNAWPNGGYPEVIGFFSTTGQARSQLEAGDRVIRVGDRDLSNQGQLGYGLALADAVSRASGPVAMLIERNGQRLAIAEPVPERPEFGRRTGLFIALVWGLAAILIQWRAPKTPGSRALVLALASSALLYTAAFETTMPLYLASVGIAAVSVLLSQPLLLRAYLSFPEEANALRGWNRVWPWAFLPVGVLLFSANAAFPFPPTVAGPAATASVVLYVIALAFALGRNYRRSGPVGRRQIKWVVYCVYLGSLIALGTYAVVGVAPVDTPIWADIAVTVASISFPLSVLIAVLRFDLLDIDRLIGATLAYNVLAIVVVGTLLLVFPLITQDLASRLGIDAAVGRSGVALGLAGAMVLVQRRIRPHVDRLFFKERFALERAMKELPEKLAVVRRIDALFQVMGNELVTHLRPRGCTVFASAGTTFVPVFQGDDTVTAAVAADSELVTWLRAQDEALRIERRATRDLGASGRAALSRMEARVVLPIQRARQLEAFVCLGEKRSGDIYTATDLALLTALARSMALHLMRFDEAELLERSRAIQEKMRRYVPGAVAEEIAQGRDLVSGEREVSVLFVDIRGYTAFSDGREASTIFSTVNRYTEAVSQVVRDAGGVVVEFNGDGMMAVFGAPVPLAHKESASLSAARRLVNEVAGLPRGELTQPLSVGIGITTGLAFVGNIEAADRTIWTAIGSGVNLAARLQSLTRELNASILIDAVTHDRAGEAAAGLVPHRAVAIRGLKEPASVYALPLDATA